MNATIKNTANNWNQNDELRAFASFTTQIKIANHTKKIINAVRNRKELSRRVLKNHSIDEKGFQIISEIFQLHSNVFMASCANCHVSMILQKI